MNADRKSLPAVNQPASPNTPRPYLRLVEALSLDAIESTPPSKTRKRGKSQGYVAATRDGVIPESSRNNTLMSLAGSMRAKGMTHQAIEVALLEENRARCRPPLDESEVRQIASNVMRYAPTDPTDVAKTFNDAGNADRFGKALADRAMFVFGLGWHFWDGSVWRRDESKQVNEEAKAVARSIYAEAAAIANDDLRKAIAVWAGKSLQVRGLKAMIELAESLPQLSRKAHELDSDDYLLGVANGVVDLRTGKMRPAESSDLITRRSPVTYQAGAKAPVFEAFLDQITGGDKKLASYFQRVVGYALTGSTEEQCVFFLYGSGANGKSTFLNVAVELLGPRLTAHTPTETLMVKRGQATNDIARLQGVRMVVANELDEGQQLAEALIKQMTGGDTMAARFHYQEFFEFKPKFKLFIAGNHKPIVQGRDNGIWRRLRLIPFDVTIPKKKQDKRLLKRLMAELPGILNWAIAGAIKWQKSGLDEPSIVTQAVDQYRQEMDLIGQWIGDECTLKETAEWQATPAYLNYKHWAELNGYRPMAAGTFGREIASRFTKVKRKDANYYIGITSKATARSPG